MSVYIGINEETYIHITGVLNWRYDTIHGARECQRVSIFFPAPLELHVYTCIIIIQGVKLVVGTKLLAPAKLIFNTPDINDKPLKTEG